MNLPPTIRLDEEMSGYPILKIQHPTVTGSVALHGAHVMEWTPSHATSPVLFMSADSLFEPGKPIRGGIPVCWPWFGPHSEPDKPAHGFVRTMFWEIDHADEHAAGVDIVLRLADSRESCELWPHAFEVRLHIHMGRELSVGLEVTNTDSTPWSMTAALHSYFAVGDAKRISLHGLHGTEYVESRLSPEKRPERCPLVIDREVDRLYVSDATVIVRDPVWKRELHIEKSGSLSTVVWNPWIEKSKRLNDLPDQAYHGFVCVETANAGEDIVTVAPGATHRLFTRIGICREILAAG